MHGYADFKSHLLRRDEKGIFGVPFKRWLLSGCVAGLVLVLSRIVIGDLSVPVGVMTAVLALILSAPVGGIPRAQRVLLDYRWRLAKHRARSPHSLIGGLAELLQVPPDDLQIDGAAIFNLPEIDPGFDTRLSDWTIFTQLSDLNAGLVVLQDLNTKT